MRALLDQSKKQLRQKRRGGGGEGTERGREIHNEGSSELSEVSLGIIGEFPPLRFAKKMN